MRPTKSEISAAMSVLARIPSAAKDAARARNSRLPRKRRAGADPERRRRYDAGRLGIARKRVVYWSELVTGDRFELPHERGVVLVRDDTRMARYSVEIQGARGHGHEYTRDPLAPLIRI